MLLFALLRAVIAYQLQEMIFVHHILDRGEAVVLERSLIISQALLRTLKRSYSWEETSPMVMFYASLLCVIMRFKSLPSWYHP
jgi:hypothetical protein